MSKFSDLIGKILIAIEGLETDSDEVRFICSDGSVFKMYHEQDCCESVAIYDVVGDVTDLLNVPILMAEEVEGETPPDDEAHYYESQTWTFYKLATVHGYVDIRWLGTSNGYYSESVDFEQVI